MLIMKNICIFKVYFEKVVDILTSFTGTCARSVNKRAEGSLAL